jgi:hypothetical protein
MRGVAFGLQVQPISMGMSGRSVYKVVCIAAGVMAACGRLGWMNEKGIQGSAWIVVDVAIGDAEGQHNA